MQLASEALEDFAGSSFEVIHMMSRFFGALAILTYFMSKAAIVVAIITVVVVAIIVLYDRILIGQYERLNRLRNRVAAGVQDFLTNVATVISLRLEDRAGREIQFRLERILPIAKKNWVTCELKWFTTSILVKVTQVGVLFGYLLLKTSRAELVEVGTFYALYAYLTNIGDSFFQFTGKYGDIMVKSTRVRAVGHVSEAHSTLSQRTDSTQLPSKWKLLELFGVRFTHSSNNDIRSA